MLVFYEGKLGHKRHQQMMHPMTPLAFRDGNTMGIGVRIEDLGKVDTWGLLTPHNAIACWRAALILEQMPLYEYALLETAYEAGRRHSTHDIWSQTAEETIVEIIGREVYDSIMTTAIPDPIVEFILVHQSDDDPPERYPLVEEMIAGTLAWQERFTDYGIRRPSQLRV